MLETPEVTHVTAQPIAAIHLTIPRSEIQTVMGAGITELMAALAEQGVEPAGPWLNHHLRMNPEVFDFEIAVPVATPIKPVGRVVMSELPPATVVRAVYRGGYEGLGEAWGELDAWIAAEGMSAAPGLWEIYTVGPESGPDSEGYRTELNRPVLG